MFRPQLFALLAVVLLTGCREIRVNEFSHGTTTVLGPRAVLVVRDARTLDELGIREPSVRFSKEFAVVLLMGPHREAGYKQVIESIRANLSRVRIVAYEKVAIDSGEPTREYLTYTLWIVPNSVYRRGSIVDAVTPSGDPIATTVLH